MGFRRKPLFKFMHVTFMLLAFLVHLSLQNSAKRHERLEREFITHRIELLEDGLKTFVDEEDSKVSMIEQEIAYVKGENHLMQIQLADQQRVIEDLQWATANTESKALTWEERDMVTELKWTIFDLKNSNKELEEEICFQNAECAEWMEWSHCSNSCGTGTRIRSRKCENHGRFASKCDPINVQEEKCRGTKCALLPQFDCPAGYSSYQGYCFRFSGRSDARLLSTMLCEEEGGHLVYIDSDMKHNIVMAFLNITAPEYMVNMNEDFSKREYWDFQDIDQKTHVAIDGVRRHQQTYFVNWRDNEMSYYNWAVGQPRNDKSDKDYCATVNMLDGKWYMKCCSVVFYYVCESQIRI